jgi:hypothetical protein
MRDNIVAVMEKGEPMPEKQKMQLPAQPDCISQPH